MRLGALATALEPALHARIQADPTLREARSTVAEPTAGLDVQARHVTC
jgi:hypothetical protein